MIWLLQCLFYLWKRLGHTMSYPKVAYLMKANLSYLLWALTEMYIFLKRYVPFEGYFIISSFIGLSLLNKVPASASAQMSKCLGAKVIWCLQCCSALRIQVLFKCLSAQVSNCLSALNTNVTQLLFKFLSVLCAFQLPNCLGA